MTGAINGPTKMFDSYAMNKVKTNGLYSGFYFHPDLY